MIFLAIYLVGFYLFIISLNIPSVVEHGSCTCFALVTIKKRSRVSLAGKSERFYKRHVLPKGYVHRPILIVRDPRDVWVSFYFMLSICTEINK